MDIIILVTLAIFIFIKLREQLGKIDENEKKEAIRKFIKEQTEKPKDLDLNKNDQPITLNIVPNDKDQVIANIKNENTKSNAILIFKKFNISATDFMKGANKAFEIIIESFANGNISKLKGLLSENILQQFELTIKERKEKREMMTTKVISIIESEIVAAKSLTKQALITVKFVSKQINYTIDGKGKLISGSKKDVNLVSDLWTFKKDYESLDRNWFLSATGAAV